jgi:predicted nucleic acid-binding protein
MRRRGNGVLRRCVRLDRSVLGVGPVGRATNSMSAEGGGREFVDTNVLVYAFDTSAGLKQTAAVRLLERLWREGGGCLSVQVLQEFFVIATRKVARPLSIDEATERVREFARWRVFAPAGEDILDAIAIQKQMQIGFWDAMVVLAARESGCQVLWTEDLNNGQRFGGIRVRNPFADLEN